MLGGIKTELQTRKQHMPRSRITKATFASVAAFIALVPLAQSAQFSVHLVDQTGPTIDGIVDTTTDAFVISSWANAPSATTWTPLLNQFPLTLRALSDSGEGFDVPDTWDGAVAAWAFVLPVGQSITTVQWQQGTPSSFWADSSFGWGGYRFGTTVGHIGDITPNTIFPYVPFGDGAGVTDAEFEIVSVTPVPEPSAAVLALMSGLMAWHFIRRRHARAA